MIEENKVEVRRLQMPAEGFNRSGHPEYYDSLVQVRCPYTGVLDPPRATATHGDFQGNACDPTTRVDDDERSGTPSAWVEVGQMATRFVFSWNRFRFAMASFAAAVCAGFVLFAITATGWDPLPSTAHRIDAATSRQQRHSVAPVKQLDKADAVLPAAPTPAPPITLESTSAAKATQDGETTKTAVAVALPPVSAPAMTEAMGATGVDSKSYNDLLEAANKSKQNKQRVALLREAIGLYPQGDEAMARLSIILMEKSNNRQEALDLAERASALNGDNAMAWLAIGYINQMKGSMKEAKQAYGKCAAAPGPLKFVRDCRNLI